MAGPADLRRLTDLISVTHEREADPAGGRPNLGTLVTRAIETIDNDCESWFPGVLPPG